MEVHHHSHHPKKWKEHFLEFLMLFLAVTLGFFAENIRDQYVERERAHEYLQHLESDIDNNIHFIDSLTNRDKVMVRKFDSAFLYLSTAKELDIDSLYKNLPVNIFRFLSKNNTYEQMKSSGSLRYIKDENLLEMILNYSDAAQAAESRSTLMETEFTTSHWVIATSSFMTENSAIADFLNNRRGVLLNNQNDFTSKLLVDSNFLNIEKQLIAVEKQKIVYTGENLVTLKRKLLPYLARRQALLINTIRFMSYAKEKGEALKKYIAQNH